MPYLAVAVPYIAAAAAAVGTGVAVYGQVESANTASAAQDAEADRLASEQAAADEAKAIEADDRQRRLNRIMATQRATFGAGGVNPLTGSAQTFRSASVGEAAREQFASNLFAEREQKARDARTQFTSFNKGQIGTSRNINIGSSILQSANSYLQTQY